MESMNLNLMIPEIALLVLGLVILMADLFTSPEARHRLGWWAAGGFSAVALYLFLTPTPAETQYAAFGLYRIDGFALFFKKVFILAGILVAVMSVDWIRRFGRGSGEYFTIVIFAMLGMFLVAGVNDLMSMFVSLELVTLSFFILSAFRIHDRLSGEAGIKYIIIGALAAAFMLMGMAFVYGATGELRFRAINDKIALVVNVASPEAQYYYTLLFGVVLLLVGLGFKVASVPFHIWVPDVYQGSPSPVTAFLSVGSKTAGFVLILRVVTLMLGGALSAEITILLALVAGLTLFYGNLAAIPQVNIKRLMGYSSIGHAGYLMLGVVAIVVMKGSGGDWDMGVTAILFYLFAYVFTNMALFLGIVVYSAARGREHQIGDYAGLGKRSPFLALCMTIALLSLAGAPPLAGFFGKFYLISAIVEAARVADHGWLLVLAAVGVVNVVISLYYYLCVVKQIYMREPTDDEPITIGAPVRVALLVCMAMIVLIGIFQGPFVEMAESVLATM